MALLHPSIFNNLAAQLKLERTGTTLSTQFITLPSLHLWNAQFNAHKFFAMAIVLESTPSQLYVMHQHAL